MTDETAILAFATKWRHWDGGPDEDIFVEFGVSPTVFFHRLRAILNSPRWSQLSPSLAQQLREICDNRLRSPETRAS
ncbi:DUF3263 domain-containing protein [Rhodococcus sp. HM1]|uniref:DUF3263 domain-containing protein n=1 Tax=Rhodococcus sp. HM1 TaxID=2937759 RepID=UPI00200B4CF6|nr:DUF3263 domain-containing protein [Rhodococcus sp. HM1]MCK8670361.1 DUF3263 domain-containing protein [Rhodococcus sp. HM1]